MLYARSKRDEKGSFLPFSDGQPLDIHTYESIDLAAEFASKFGATELGRISAGYHDFGKALQEFQEYLKRNEVSQRGSVPHSIHGARAAFDALASLPPVAELISNCILAHHGSLYDFISPDGSTPLTDRISSITWSTDTPVVFDFNVEATRVELGSMLMSSLTKDHLFFISMFIKMIYSCLIDADRLNAYLFDVGKAYSKEAVNWESLLKSLHDKLPTFSSSSEMDILRKKVSEACAAAGSRDRGIYQLEVPTGGGKTLSSLRFAMEHAKHHGLDRIIYVIPFLSILSQTAKDIREALHADDTTVLEHHSGFLPDHEEFYKLHTDRWDAPIILTTQVQFLESVFSSRGSDLRKMHNMARSVLIFDEVQSLPVKCVHLFNGVINFLHKICGSTVLLCTATQPLLNKVERCIRLAENPSLVECEEAPRRYEIKYPLLPEGYTISGLAEFILEKNEQSTLVILNTKSTAKALHKELKNLGVRALHLSTNMCSAHRDDVFMTMRTMLGNGEKFVCVSTQLIEAGVNISFTCVVRALAGLDCILQAAGRCNRHGEYGEVKFVYVVNIKGEDLSRLPDIKKGAEVTRKLLDDEDLCIESYYEHYFYARRGMMDYPTSDGGSIYDLLSQNCQGQEAFEDRKDKARPSKPKLLPAIQSASESFFVIEKGRTEVIVPYGDSEELVSKYLAESSLEEKRILLRKLGKYSVSLYQYQIDELQRRRALVYQDGVISLVRGFYDKDRGVDVNGNHEFLNA